MSTGVEADFQFKDEGYIELVLRVLGLMCDNQYRDLQVSVSFISSIASSSMLATENYSVPGGLNENNRIGP